MSFLLAQNLIQKNFENFDKDPATSLGPYSGARCCHCDEIFTEVQLNRSGEPLFTCTRALPFVLHIFDFTLCKQKSPHNRYSPEKKTTTSPFNEFPHKVFLLTFLNSPVL